MQETQMVVSPEVVIVLHYSHQLMQTLQPHIGLEQPPQTRLIATMMQALL
jgi:hypothetical protein